MSVISKAAADSTPISRDVLVIGGGPGGSTVAALLAERGYQVTLLEKAHHPRFHIGESLLPANLPLFEKLGVADEVRAIGMEKWGAEFHSPWHAQKSQTFHFMDAWDKSMPYAYQVPRAEFDHILLRNAARKGVEVLEGCRARTVDLDRGDGLVSVRAEHEDGRSSHWHARFLIDASGRDTFLGNQFKSKRRNPRHNSSALYAHFAGVRRTLGKDEGNIAIFWFEHGWFWMIPLANGITSIGAVVWPYYLKTRTQSVEAFFFDTIAQCPALVERLTEARLVSPVEATGNFSYACGRPHGPRYLMVGDAFTFIDPVFSSGVMLAMHGGFVAAETVDVCLKQPAHSRRARNNFQKLQERGPRQFSWFIYRVNHPTMRDLFMGPRNVLGAKAALLSVLAGDIFRDTPIWVSLWIFKLIYYINVLGHIRRSWSAWLRRRRNIRPVDGEDAATGS